MPYNSSTGVYTPASGATTANPGDVIQSATWNSIFTDLATALTTPTPSSLISPGAVKSTSPSAGVGYATGAGGTVTQGTSRSTAVTLNTATGTITLFTAAGSATWTTFQVNNSQVAATDTIILSVRNAGASNVYLTSVLGVGTGAFAIAFATSGGTASDTPLINFTVIKSVTS